MKGQILDFNIQTNFGHISGDNGERYVFSGAEWKGNGTPIRGMRVDFEFEGNQAKGVYNALVGVGSSSTKNKTAAGLLGIFLGGLGIHKFYLGFTGPGLVYLLVNTIGFAITWIFLFIPNIVLGVMALIEGILYISKSDEDFEQTYLIGKKQWF